MRCVSLFFLEFDQDKEGEEVQVCLFGEFFFVFKHCFLAPAILPPPPKYDGMLMRPKAKEINISKKRK